MSNKADPSQEPSPSRPAAAWLCAPTPDGPAERPLTGEETLLGRTPPADVVLPLPQVSRRHALIRREGGGHSILDLQSQNGTFVNGEQVGALARRLAHDDIIVLGGAVQLRYCDPTGTLAGPRIGRLSGIWVDDLDRSVWVDGNLLSPPLSAAQYGLLALPCGAAGTVVTRAQIVAAVWPDCHSDGVSEEAIDGVIKRLRARLRQMSPDHDYVEVLRGHGLRLTNPPEP